jgi:hypothetical protein
MAKTYELGTAIGMVRLYGGEKDTVTSKYEDEEIQLFLDDAEGDINLATALLWEAKASAAANKATQKTIGKLSTNKAVTAEYALKMAALYREKAGLEPCAEVAEVAGTDFQEREILDPRGRYL